VKTNRFIELSICAFVKNRNKFIFGVAVIILTIVFVPMLVEGACVDSDDDGTNNGLAPFKRGSIPVGVNRWTDFCVNFTHLREHYCDGVNPAAVDLDCTNATYGGFGCDAHAGLCVPPGGIIMITNTSLKLGEEYVCGDNDLGFVFSSAVNQNVNWRSGVRLLDGKPAVITKLPNGTAYKYLETLTINLLPAWIGKGVALFGVEKSWLGANNASEASVKFWHWNETLDTWDGYSVYKNSMAKASNETVYYAATVWGFSYYVITGEAGSADVTTNETLCGNAVLDYGEDCDTKLNFTKTCESLGWDGGTLACNSLCKFDTTGCVMECNATAFPEDNGTWTECEEESQDFIVYKCDSRTGAWIKSIEETRDCGGLGAWWFAIIGGGLLVLLGGLFALWYFYLGPRGMLLGDLYNSWFGGGFDGVGGSSAEKELEGYTKKKAPAPKRKAMVPKKPATKPLPKTASTPSEQL